MILKKATMGNFHSLLFGEARTGHDQQRPETKRYLFGSYIKERVREFLRSLRLICRKPISFFFSGPRKNCIQKQQPDDTLLGETTITSSSNETVLLIDGRENDAASVERGCPDEENNICKNVDHVVIAIPELERTSVSKDIKADSSVFTERETTETDANVKDDGEREVTKNVTMEVSIRDDHERVQENSSIVGTVEKSRKSRRSRKRKDVKTVMVVDEARWIKYYSSSHNMLLVGEGDFSFSACLAMAFESASNMIATSLDSEEFFMENYQKAESNIEELISRGAKVMHGIDATEMANHYSLGHFKFDRIIFNFPFAGFFNETRDSQLRRHRRLVSKFLMNAKEMIREDGEIHISHKTNGFHNEWNLESIASSHGLRLIEAVTFSRYYYPGYNTKYGFGGDENFNCYPSNTFKFGLREV